MSESSSAGFRGSAFPTTLPSEALRLGRGGEGRPFEREEPLQIRILPHVCGHRICAVGAFPQSPLAGVYFYPAELKGRRGYW